MRSIPVTMTWEMLRRGRWNLIAAMFVAIALPAVVLAAVRGQLGTDDEIMLRLHSMFACISMTLIGAAVLSSQNRVSRLYAFPVRTSTIVAWRLIPMMILTIVQMVICTALINQLFNLHWPVETIAIFSGVAVAAVQAVIWLTEKSGAWLATALSLVGLALGLWFNSEYGSLASFGHYWYQVSFHDAVVMTLVTLVAFFVATKAVARNRRGEPPFSVGFIAWLERVFDETQKFEHRFRSPFEAQCWLEWRRKGRTIPFAIAMLIVFGFVAWFFGSRDPDDLLISLLAGGSGLSVVGGIGGFIFGNFGHNDADFTMGHFFATRPLSDADLGWAVLKNIAKSILLTWCIWAAALVAVCCFVVFTGSGAVSQMFRDADWRYIPYSLACLWVVAATITSLGLSGRGKIVLQSIFVLAALVISEIALSQLLLMPESRHLVDVGCATMLCGLVLLGAGWVIVKAWRRQLISRSIAWTVILIWIVATIATCLIRVPWSDQSWGFNYLLVAVLMALAVLPVASMPVAVWLNRHR